jgi:hypothetical protein
MEMKMVKFSDSDSFIGILDLKNVVIEPKVILTGVITFTG